MGKKIKSFANTVMIIGSLVCLIASAYTLISCYDRNGGFHLLQYATANGGVTNPYLPAKWEAQGNNIYFSIRLAVYFALGVFGCLLYGLPVYWLGCLFERVELLQGDSTPQELNPS